MQPLPSSLGAQMVAVPGVRDVAWANWFGGAYQDPRNQIFTFAVSGNYLDLYTEMDLPKEQRTAFDANLNGIVAGDALAKRFGWKVGQRIPLQSQIFPNSDGSKDWQFDLEGILKPRNRSASGFSDNIVLLHWKKFDESTPYNQGAVGWYVTRVRDVGDADRVARAIDALSANSDHETKTQTEQAATAGWIKQTADIALIVGSIMGAVFFTLLLLTGNTMMQSVRERTSELAVLKTIGFTDAGVMGIVMAESVLLLLIGGCIGLGLVSLLVPVIVEGSGGMLNLPRVGVGSWLLGVALMLLIGMAVGMLPAWQALRLRITDALAGR
jgi:putative ABC transport system permease protein